MLPILTKTVSFFSKPQVSRNVLAPYALDTPLLAFADGSHWLLRDLFEHVHVFGGPGSGKSSGSLATLYRICASGMGMLCLTAKEDEPGRLIRMALEAGRREEDILVIDDTLAWRFNFLNYELTRRGGGDTFTIVETLLSMMEAKRRLQSWGGGDDSRFWRDAAHEMLTHAINVLRLSQGTLRLRDIHAYLASLPRSAAQLGSASFLDQSFAARQLALALERSEREGLGPEAGLAQSYMEQGAFGDPRTIGNILITITSMLQPFLSGVLHELFCTDTTWTPELVLSEGKLTIIAFPVLLYKQLGVLAQVIFKAAFAQACGARPDDAAAVPVVLYADEAQSFYTEDDNRLAEMGRSKRVAMIYGTQNIGNYIRALGGPNAQAISESLLGNFGTLLFHANKHPGTNRFAADIIGRRLQLRDSVTSSGGVSRGISGGRSAGISHGQSAGRSGGRSWGWSRGTSWGRSRSDSHTTGGQGGGSYTVNSVFEFPAPSSRGSSWGWNWGRSTTRGTTNGGQASRTGGGNEGWTEGTNDTVNYGTTDGWNQGQNEGWSRSAAQQMDYDLEPGVFVGQLRTGGKRHRNLVDAIAVQTGRQWAGGRNWMLVSFRQEQDT